jgi:hypothetical protein
VKEELCAKERLVVFPGGRIRREQSAGALLLLDQAIASDRGEERRSEWSWIEGSRSEEKLCAKERLVVFPRGRIHGEQSAGALLLLERAITSDCGEE